MINNDVLSQLQFLIKTSAPPLLEVSQQELEMPQLVPGQKVPAHVVANLPNGRFQVLIADKALDMNLPKNTQPGDTIDLVFVTSQPRLTFVLAKDLGAVVNSAKPQVSLSETARFLGGLLEKAAQPGAQKGEASAVVHTTPLLAGAPPANSLDFAQALRGALSRSGLFYESHQAQWVTGQRPLSDLLHEPQGRLSSPAAFLSQADALKQQSTGQVQGSAGPRSAELPRGESALLARLGGASIPMQVPVSNPGAQAAEATALQSSATQLQNDGQSLVRAALPDQPAHPETLPIVRQQLETLDSRQVMWQGQVWPGQTMDWRIEEREAHEQGGEMVLPEWQTSLRLVLPQLGEVAAKLTLHPQGVRIQLNAAESVTAHLMTEQATALQEGMQTSGLQVVEMKVRHGPAG